MITRMASDRTRSAQRGEDEKSFSWRQWEGGSQPKANNFQKCRWLPRTHTQLGRYEWGAPASNPGCQWSLGALVSPVTRQHEPPPTPPSVGTDEQRELLPTQRWTRTGTPGSPGNLGAAPTIGKCPGHVGFHSRQPPRPCFQPTAGGLPLLRGLRAEVKPSLHIILNIYLIHIHVLRSTCALWWFSP